MNDSARAPRELALAIALAALFAFTALGHPLEAPDEPRVAGIAWEMQHTGQWWVPHLGGEPFLEHPPLFYAALGACLRAFGASENVARLPGAIASFATMLLVFGLARRVADRTAAIPALLALIGIAAFGRQSHSAVVDPLLMMFVTAGYYAYVRAVWSAPRGTPEPDAERVASGWLVGVYLAAALAFWVKGPIGVVAVGGPLALDVLWGRRWRVISSPAHLVGLPLLAALCVAWPLVLYEIEGEAAARTFLVNNVGYRIAPSAGGGAYLGGHAQPFWFYLPQVFGQLGYATLLAPAVAAWLWRGDLPPGWRVSALRFLGAVFPIGVLLLSIPGTKRAPYLLPFEPPLAVAIGAWLAAIARGDGVRSRVEAVVCALCVRALGWMKPIAAVGDAWRAPLRLTALAFAVTLTWNNVGLPFTGHRRDLGPMARAVGERVGDAPLVMFQPSEALLGALPFYAGRIPPYAHELAELATIVARSDARYVLAPVTAYDALVGALGRPAVLEASWKTKRAELGLFAIPAQLPPSPLADRATGLIPR